MSGTDSSWRIINDLASSLRTKSQELDLGAEPPGLTSLTVEMDPLPATPLFLPHSLPFPLTVQRIHSPTGSAVRKTQSLCTYSYTVLTKEGKKEREVKVWESPVQGDVTQWDLREGEVIKDAR